MDISLPFIGGIVCKLYDDLYDNNILTNETFKEILKGSHWITLTLSSYNDFNFTIIALFINFMNFLFNSSAWLYPYETSVMSLYPIFLFLSFPIRKSIGYVEVFYLLFMTGGMIWDPLVMTEEFSHRKFLQRTLVAICSLIGIVGGLYFDVSFSFIKLSIYSLGYFLSSSIFQLYMLNQDNDKVLQTIALLAKPYRDRVYSSMVPNNRYVSSRVSIRTTIVQCKNVSS